MDNAMTFILITDSKAKKIYLFRTAETLCTIKQDIFFVKKIPRNFQPEKKIILLKIFVFPFIVHKLILFGRLSQFVLGLRKSSQNREASDCQNLTTLVIVIEM